jgi:CubicO group peptidase (beta-lactamase class C family)
VKCSRSNAAKDNGGPGITGRRHPARPDIVRIKPAIIRNVSIYLFYTKLLIFYNFKELKFPAMKINTCVKYLLISLLLLFLSESAYSQPITSAEIDQVVANAMKSFRVPGMAVAVIKDGAVVHSKGYGVRSIATGEKMDENTLFAIASNSKAFTAAALGILISEGKLQWNSRVSDIIPEFRLYDPYVSLEFTVADLLSHRSGLGLGAGDLMLWPDGSDFTVEDIIHNLRYLKPVSQFRTKYDYDNLLYIVAGEVVSRVAGMSWEDFVQERILTPLGMARSAPCYSRLQDMSNIIEGHMVLEGKLVVVPMRLTETANSAGGIYSSVADMSEWVKMQLAKGSYGDGKRLFPESVQSDMFTPQTVIPVRDPGYYNTNFRSYGLGWRLCDIMGYKEISHTGGLSGVLTQVTLIPRLRLGIIVFTNQQSSEAFMSVTNTIKDSYIGAPGRDWVKVYEQSVQESTAEADKIISDVWKRVEVTAGNNANDEHELARYTGIYKDNWLGEISIYTDKGKLLLKSKRSPGLEGEMFRYSGNVFVVRWFDRSMEADAFAVFSEDMDGKPSGMTMKAISPQTDFSYDFHDLSFSRVVQ